MEIFPAASGVLVWIGRMISSSSLSIIYTAVDYFRHRASLILAGIEILQNLSILAILSVMADWGLFGLRFLSAVVGLRMGFSSTTQDVASLCAEHQGRCSGVQNSI